ncbi:MAG: peptidase [Pirellulaceae bacterium]|nr:peptidase [Pirellulaceae bacterium]
MNRRRWYAVCAAATLAATLLADSTELVAQTASKIPHIGYIFPAGGRQGTEFDVVVGGQDIADVQDIYFSGSGIKAKVVKWYRPLTQGQYVSLSQKIQFTREDLQAEQEKRGSSEPVTDEMVYKVAGITENDLREMEIYRQRNADPKRQPNDQIAEELTLRITIDAGAKLGKREMRVLNAESMSNPIWFQVGQWEERQETEPNDVAADPVIGSALPVVVNGQIMPGDVDRFSFTARKGTRLVIAADARELMPYLADAVPGWFQAVLILYDRAGAEIAYAGAFYHRQDPVIYYEIPEDGDYAVEIRDSIYRGREDFVYRLTLGELPFVTGVFPLGARAGQEVTVELQGWNLVETQLNVRALLDRNRPVRWYDIPQNDKVSIHFPLRIDMTGEVLDLEPNDSQETAQEVALPIVVNGRIDRRDDRDVFRFDAHGLVVADVFARRAGSPLDSSLLLVDSTGKEIAFNDDVRDDSQALLTHHADSRFTAVMNGKGPYYLHLSDAQRNGGHDFIYRLYIHPPRPDFELRVVPSCIIARPGATVPITVHAFRRDGFNDPIHLSLVESPEGFRLNGAVVPADADQVQLTLTVPTTDGARGFFLEMEGLSVGSRRHRRFSRPAVPAESMMQAFLWTQVVPAEQWAVIVNGQAAVKNPVEFVPVERASLRLGGSTPLAARLTAKYPPAQELRLELIGAPKGVSVEKVTPEGQGLIVTLAADAASTVPDSQGNLIFEVFREWTPAPTEAMPKPQPRRQSFGILPAIPFQMVGQAPRK